MQDITFLILIVVIIASPNIIAWVWVVMDWRKKKGKYRTEIIMPDGGQKIGYFAGTDNRLSIYEGGKGQGNKAFNPEFSTTCFKKQKHFLGLRSRQVLECVWGADKCIDYNSIEIGIDGKRITPVPKYSRETIRNWLKKEFFDIWPKSKQAPNFIVYLTFMISVFVLILLVTGGL